MRAPDWTDDAAYAVLGSLDPSALAWEFLRRNSRYQEAVAQGRRVEAFGLRFPVDPELGADDAQPIWITSAAPGVSVELTPIDRSEATVQRLCERGGWSREAEDGLHLRFPNGLQALIPGAVSAMQPLAAVLPINDHFASRLHAACALRRGLLGPWSDLGLLSRARRVRLSRTLRAHDGRQEGASYRDIAKVVLGEVFEDSVRWRTSSARATAIRLCTAGRELVAGSYKRLLGGG